MARGFLGDANCKLREALTKVKFAFRSSDRAGNTLSTRSTLFLITKSSSSFKLVILNVGEGGGEDENDKLV